MVRYDFKGERSRVITILIYPKQGFPKTQEVQR